MKGFSQECQTACNLAVMKFREICENVLTGDITMCDLDQVSANRELMDRLCAAIDDPKFTSQTISEAVDQRVKEFLFFKNRRSAYQDVCNWILSYSFKIAGRNYIMLLEYNAINPVLLTGLDDFIIELSQDVKNTCISKLCQYNDDGSLQLLCYQSAKSLDPFIDHFKVMMKHSSILFLDPLGDRLRRLVITKPNLAIDQIYFEIWQPVFEQCRSLLQTLDNQSMKLSFVDKHLQRYKDDINNVVFNLAVGVYKCLRVEPDYNTLTNALGKVEQYWKLCQYQTGAQIFLQLKNVMHLKGDFSLIEKLSDQVS